jgi:outer membrane lipoprotein-sorting protein
LTARLPRLLSVLAGAWWLVLAPPAASAEAADTADTADARLAHLVGAYQVVHTLSAAFTQETYFPGFPRPRTFGGTVDLERPDHMRWSYTEGSTQQVYVNRPVVTVYIPESSQAIESHLSPASDRQVPLNILADVTHIPDTYLVEAGEGEGALVLTPRSPDPAAPKAVRLWLAPDTGLIQRVRLDLPGGSRSDITFRDVRVNVPIDPARFVVNLPEGIHRIEAEAVRPSRRNTWGP